MSTVITLSRYATGDTNYVAKMDSDNVILEGAINTLFGQVGAITLGSGSGGNQAALDAEYGLVTAIIGSASYVPVGSGTNLTVSSGYAYVAASSLVVQDLTSTILSFSALGAATYYIDVDTSGNISRVAALDANTLWSVVWTGSAFGAITRVAPYFLNSADVLALYTSTALSATYPTVRARFEAIESHLSTTGGNALATYASAAGTVNNVPASGGFPVGINRVDVTLPSGVASHTGLLAGSDGQRVIYSNQDATNALTLVPQASTSTAANRFMGPPLTLAPGESVELMYYAGSINRWRMLIDALATPPLSTFFPGVPGSSQILLLWVADGSYLIPAGTSNKDCLCLTAATGLTTITINHIVSGTPTAIGTVVVSASGTVGAFTFSSAVVLAEGDAVSIVGPATADATAANIAISMRMIRLA